MHYYMTVDYPDVGQGVLRCGSGRGTPGRSVVHVCSARAISRRGPLSAVSLPDQISLRNRPAAIIVLSVT